MESETPDQPPVEEHPGNGVNVLAAVADGLANNGAPAGYRVAYRTNPRGEHVVAAEALRE
jgi:hypothetical protein